MRFFTLAATVLGGVALASAFPAGPGAPNDPNMCCCCDTSQPAIVCTTSVNVFSCACLAVQCPEDAPILYRNLDEEPLPTPPSDPIPPTPPAPTPPGDGEMEECCCCVISQPAISCVMKPIEEGCICPLVLCPPDAPTVYPESPAPDPTPTPQPSILPAPAAMRHVEEEDKEVDCCCCSIGEGVISCDKRPESEGCFCPQVVCPDGAPTVYERFPEPTSAPEPQVFTRPPYAG